MTAELHTPDRHHVKYSRICPLNSYDFTPARVTRRSDNPLLQEHCTIDLPALYVTLRKRHNPSQEQLRSLLARAAEGERKLRGKYIELQFADSYPGCDTPAAVPAARTRGDSDVVSSPQRDGEWEDPPTAPPTYTARPSPLFIRSRTERRRTAFRKRSDDTKSGGCGSGSLSTSAEETEDEGSTKSCSLASEPGTLPDPERDMDVESGVVMYHDRLGRTAIIGSVVQQQGHSYGYVPRPLGRGLVRPVPFQLPAAEAAEALEEAPFSPPSRAHDPSSPPCSFGGMRPSSGWQEADEGGVPAMIGSLEEEEDDSSGSDVSCESPQPLPDVISSRNHHQPLARQLPQTTPSSLPSSSPIGSNARYSKPLPPPKAKSQGDVFRSSSEALEKVKRNNSKSHPDLTENTTSSSTSQSLRSRSVSFLDCSAGAELGRYPADYLGSRQADSYIGHADSIAKELINSKPVEVVVYVTSEKIRLAPPKSSSLLFKSFAVKDILSVQKCSKNRRIVCVSVWKSRRTPPQCHTLRCPSALVSSALYDSILDQTQNVDDIASSDKLSSSRLTSRSPESSTTDHPFSTNDRDLPTPPPMTPDPPSPRSPSEFLHKIPAVHVGSARAGRHDSVNDIIQKVLTDRTPMGSREISVWLSQAQLRLVDMSDEREMVFEAHETSRIRAIGVYLEDKRFIGYIVKEEGKPLLGHVLRCNSAALMVSLVSFLRQAVQIMFSQQGGSLYDELSSDESDSEPSTESSAQCQGLFKKLRCIANPHKPLCQTSSQPTFVSHTPPPPHSPNSHQHSPAPADTSFKAPPPLSPLDVPEEQFARFSVTYVGSAVTEPPFSPTSLVHALSVFKEGGVAAGKAAVAKNVIQMHVSSLGINLVDKKHRLFVNRNYPRKQLVGYCRDSEDEKLFAFGSLRQGYPNEIKCHVFRRILESTEHIMQAIHHWLELPPTTSENQPSSSQPHTH